MNRLRSVLFVVPRFHTNLFFATRALVYADIRTTIWCTEQSHIEDHAHVTPTVIAEGDRGFGATRTRLAALDPDLILLRDVGTLSKSVFVAGSLQQRRLLAYDQKPYRRRQNSTIAGLRNLIHGRPSRRMTPVPGLECPGTEPDNRAVYIPFPVDTVPANFHRDYAPEGRARILCVGKLTQPRKNHLVLLAALESLLPELDFTLTLVGSSSAEVRQGSSRHLDTLIERCATAPFEGRTTWIKDVPFADMGRIYASHDLCVLPARGEPLGSSPLEGMASGTIPVISTGCGSAGYIAGKDFGFTFPPGDDRALAEQLRPLIAAPSALPALGQRAIAHAQDELGPERFVERLTAAWLGAPVRRS